MPYFVDNLQESVTAELDANIALGRTILELKKRGQATPAKTSNPTAVAISKILVPLSALSDTIQSSMTDATSTDAENVTDLIAELTAELTQYAEAFGGVDLDTDSSDDDAPVSDESPIDEAMRRIRVANAKNGTVFRESLSRRTCKAPNCLVA